MARRNPAFALILERCDREVYVLDDLNLVTALVMFHAADEPLRTSLGLKQDRDTEMVLGFRAAMVKYGHLTWKQRKVAQRMVKWGRVHLEVLALRDAIRVQLGVALVDS